jgi:tetratricopeptide (TPR) repeat protein
VTGTVGQADLAPTLLELAGLKAEGLDGVSLGAALAGDAATGHPVYSETFYPRYHLGWSELFAATDGRYRYVRAPRPELFDLASDKAEQHNLATERTNVAGAMNLWLEQRGAGGAASAPEEVPPDVREKLQALGYVGSSGPHVTSGALPDPKDHIQAYEDFKNGLSLRLAGRREEAVTQLRKVVRANPDMRDAWEMLGVTFSELGRKKEAIEALDRTIALDPTGAEPHLALARILALDGKRDAALRHAEIAARREPGKGYEMQAQVLLDLNRADEAAAAARRSLEADPQRAMSRFVIGVVAQKAGRYEDALTSFTQAVEANRLQKGSVIFTLHARIADCLARLGREAEAEKEFLAEITDVPWSREGRVGLAMLYRSQGRDGEARAMVEGLVASSPRADAETYSTVVRTFALLGDETAARAWTARARAKFPGDARFR